MSMLRTGNGDAAQLPVEEIWDSGSGASSDDEESFDAGGRSYAMLVQSLRFKVHEGGHINKKRKGVHGVPTPATAATVTSLCRRPVSPIQAGSDPEPFENNSHGICDTSVQEGWETSEPDGLDPFQSHFADPDPQFLSTSIEALRRMEWQEREIPETASMKGTIGIPGGQGMLQPPIPAIISSYRQLKLKSRLASAVSSLELDEVKQLLAAPVFSYQDLLFAARSPANSDSLRELFCLHALNHVLKSRDKILKHNVQRRQTQEGAENDRFRDQGFARPKVLMLAETRNSCFKIANTLRDLYKPEQEENKKRFEDLFTLPAKMSSKEKPDDFRELFEGHDDNDFRIGLKFTRKAIKYFSPFYSSDIILASPLGLRRVIDHDDAKTRDHDFLSSIEVVIVDQADAMLMQNWEHVERVFEHLNLRPKEAHGCDFGRVRFWYLDDRARYLRQTMVFSAYNTPELNRLASLQMNNVAGKVKLGPEYSGTVLESGFRIRQSFVRYDSPSLGTDPESRYQYFTNATVPTLARDHPPSDAQGILVFIPSYLDFVRIRNHFLSSTTTQKMSFGSISEYTDLPDVRRARSHFVTGKHSVLLYSGRAHHFRRYSISGVKRVIMYGLPENPLFYKELVDGFLGRSIDEGKISASDAAVQVLFSPWDSLALERIVGTKRAGRMLREKGGDIFDFL